VALFASRPRRRIADLPDSLLPDGCPECGSADVIVQHAGDDVYRYECRTGHAWSTEKEGGW
jgi:ribosomal protein S27AE